MISTCPGKRKCICYSKWFIKSTIWNRHVYGPVHSIFWRCCMCLCYIKLILPFYSNTSICSFTVKLCMVCNRSILCCFWNIRRCCIRNFIFIWCSILLREFITPGGITMTLQLIPGNWFFFYQLSIGCIFLHSNTCSGILCWNLFIFLDLVCYKTTTYIRLCICINSDCPVRSLPSVCYLTFRTTFGNSGVICRGMIKVMIFAVLVCVISFCSYGILCFICCKRITI